MSYNRILKIWFSIGLILICVSGFSQTYDTLSNWEGISQNWAVSTGIGEVVTNPAPDTVNSSEHCFKVITESGMYEYMICDLDEPANFGLFPLYRIKVLAPPSGGDVTLKFENYNNTFSQEIVKSTIPGQWCDLEYNFSGLDYYNLTRMVIFWDFLGTEPGVDWYIDDIMKGSLPPLELESNLPIIVINTFGVPIPDEPKTDGVMGIIYNGPGEMNNLDDPFNDFSGSIGIETRGQSTQMFPKKSYGFETRDNSGENLDVSLLGMPAENDWILYAPYTDKSLMRNVVTFDMGHKMGNYCTRTIYCEVVINNDYKGIYVLEEKIKKDEARVDIATLKPDEISGNDLTGGYIIKVDKIDPDFIFGTDGWRSSPSPSYPNAMDIIFQYYYPEPDEIVLPQRNYISQFITNAENSLISSGFANPDEGYQKYFNVPSFIDFMLLCEISKEVDKYRYSTYFYKEKDSDGGKFFAGPAWDFNLGYGNVDYWEPGIDYTGWVYTDVQSHEWSIMFWWKRLMEDQYFRNLVKTRWVALRQGVLTDAEIHSSIDSILIHIDEAKDRNFARWPVLGEYVWPNYNWQNNTYEDEVAYFENFLFNRLEWMDNNITGTVLKPWIGIFAETNKINLTLYGDYFSCPVLKNTDFRLNNAPGGLYIQSVEYLNSKQCKLTLSDDATGYSDISVTISEGAINTWEDITSNKLGTAGIGDPENSLPEISLYESDNHIYIHCNQPELLPESVEILNVTGQVVGTYTLGSRSSVTISHNLPAGLYFAVFNTKQRPQVCRFAIAK